MCQKVHGISILEEDKCYFLFYLMLFLCIIYRLILHSFTLLEYVPNIYIFIHLLQPWHLLDTLGSFAISVYYSHMYKYVSKTTTLYIYSRLRIQIAEKNKEEI